ncbi:MAG: hypothetical protein KBT47_07095 [Armatimonadetes bacterium]|nr:hypothetical protein [Candidatus Hippobium faecium]
MILGLDFGSFAIHYVGVGTYISENSDAEILCCGDIPIQGDIQKALNILQSRMLTYDITYTGIKAPGHNSADSHIKNIEFAREKYFPGVSSIIDIGSRHTSVYLFEGNRIKDVICGGKCASGSGAFLDSMADRLGMSQSDFIKASMSSKEYAHLSGRCAVFCESDIVHLFQKGITKEKIAHGITRNIAINLKTLLEGNTLGDTALFIGGVSKNEAVLRDLREIFPETEFVTASFPFEAFASAMSCHETDRNSLREELSDIFSVSETLKTEKPLTPIGTPKTFPEDRSEWNRHYESLALGIDIGSVSTKCALISEEKGKINVVASYYRKTLGDPISAVTDSLNQINLLLKAKSVTYDKIYAGTTGSGRYLTGDYVNADLIKNEITAQVAGTVCFCPDADTIFEIGGQDSKFISLENGAVKDFEMNRVCAAGCGAFLEKQADILNIPIEDFGDIALKGKNPPSFDSNCTLFTELALRNSISKAEKPDLCAGICLAAAKNYISKTIDSRKIGNNIVFSGAVAKNRGMVAAFETLLGKEINVSDYPHINGAIGIAYLTLKQCKGSEPRFPGFQKILSRKYSLSSFRCKGCDNFCDVSVFDIKTSPKAEKNADSISVLPGETQTFYYNDRCEKYSGRKKRQSPVNLFEKYHEIMEETMARVPSPAPLSVTVGYPKGGLWNEYYPLFGAFFKACGFKVITDEDTNKTIADRGSLLAGNKPCFPLKTAFGHFGEIMDRNTNFIFLPRIINGELSTRKIAHYCPYLQALPDLIVQRSGLSSIQNSLDRPKKKTDRIISPTFAFSEGVSSVKKTLTEMGIFMGAEKSAANKAANIAFDAYWDFRDEVSRVGKNILDFCKDSAYAVLGHPYVLYDSFLNMNIGDKLSEMGIVPIPMDFLPIAKDSDWHIYQKETEKKISLAAFLKHHPSVRSVVLSYYGCGTDAFSNRFYREELGSPCYIMNLDEHTSDAGIQTRLEAFADMKSPERSAKKPDIKIKDLNRVKNRLLWLPATDRSSEVLAEAFSLFGINAKPLPPSPDENLERARKEISEDVCLPCLATMEDMLHRIRQKDFSPEKEAFFQAGANGPCRLGMYPQRQKLVLDRYGKNIPITVIDNNYFRCGLGPDFALLAYTGLFVHDLMKKLFFHASPYEKDRGEAKEVYDYYTDKLIDSMKTVHKTIKSKGVFSFDGTCLFDTVLRDAAEKFRDIRGDSPSKPVIGITGEFFMKLSTRDNRNIREYIESKGFEVWMSSLTEYFAYSNFITLHILEEIRKTYRGLKKYIGKKGEETLRRKAQETIKKLEAHYFSVTAPYTDYMTEADAEEIVRLGSSLLNPRVTGEAIVCLGKALSFWRNNTVGIINIAPFNCMPGNITEMMSPVLKRDFDNMPVLCLSYDGQEDNYERIDNFLASIN